MPPCYASAVSARLLGLTFCLFWETIAAMAEVVSTLEFDDWFARQAKPARAKVLARISNMELGNYGTCEPVGGGVSESKIDWGPGLRLYFVERGNTLVVLLCGGDKSTQQSDIERAKKLAKTV